MAQHAHLPILKKLQDIDLCNLSLICDINGEIAKKSAATFGFDSFTHNAKEVFTKKNIDAVYVLGTVKMHYEYGKSTLLSGKHLFLEKPPAYDFASLLELSDIASAHNLIAVAGFNRRFAKNINQVRDEIRKSSRISTLEASFHKPALGVVPPYGASSWLHANSIHAIDTLCYLVGESPVEMSSYANATDGEIPENFSALLRWKNGVHAIIVSNNTAGSRMERYITHCPGVTYDCENFNLVKYKDGKKEEIIYGDSFESRGFYGEDEEFIKSILQNSKPRHSLENILTSLYLVGLMERSFTGPIQLPELQKDNKNKHVSLVEQKIVQNKYDRKSILILNPEVVNPELPKIFEKYDLVYMDTVRSLSNEERAKVSAVITGRAGIPITSDLLDLLPSIEVVGVVGASLKKYNPEAIIQKGIPIINASDAYAETVAEFALMLAILGVRNASRSHDVMRKGGWGVVYMGGFGNTFFKILNILKSGSYLGKLRQSLKHLWERVPSSLKKKVEEAKGSGSGGDVNFKGISIGIIGYGAVSKKFIALLQPLGCDIKIFSEHFNEEVAKDLGIKKATLDEVLGCKVVSLHRGLSKRTIKCIGEYEIQSLKSGSVFINTSRGEIVDQDALLKRLKKGDIFACLDVFDTEPLSKSSPLRTLPNVFLTSHISGATTEMYGNAVTTVVDRVMRYLDSEEEVDFPTVSSTTMLDNMS